MCPMRTQRIATGAHSPRQPGCAPTRIGWISDGSGSSSPAPTVRQYRSSSLTARRAVARPLDRTLTSRFTVDGVEVRVDTTVHPDADVLATRVVSPLVRSGRVRILLAFPFPAGTWDKTRDWTQPDAHHTVATIARDHAQFARTSRRHALPRGAALDH